MTDVAIAFDEVEHDFGSKYSLQMELPDVDQQFGRVWKAERAAGLNHLVITCHQDGDGHIACYTGGGDEVGVFPVPPGEQAFGTWIADKISGSVNHSMEEFHLVDPTGSIFFTKSELVAVRKSVDFDSDDYLGDDLTLREITVLRMLAHSNVLPLLDVFWSLSRVTLVFELSESNLTMYMRSMRNGLLSPLAVKRFMKQIMLGVEYTHACGVVHRDLKPSNLHVGEGGTLKIGGFCLARSVTIPERAYTPDVITLWYRPLEILLGSKIYSLPVDVWSCGCILAEMASGTPFFRGDSELGTIFRIFEELGTPTEQTWRGLHALPFFKQTFPKFSRKPWAQIRNLSAQLEQDGLDLLEGLLQYNPADRTSAATALGFDYLAS